MSTTGKSQLNARICRELLEFQKKSGPDNLGTLGKGQDIATGDKSRELAAKRASEIRQHFNSMNYQVEYFDKGYESCELAMKDENATLRLFNQSIPGINTKRGFSPTSTGAPPLTFESTNMQ